MRNILRQHTSSTRRSCIYFLLIDKFVVKNFDRKRFNFHQKKFSHFFKNQTLHDVFRHFQIFTFSSALIDLCSMFNASLKNIMRSLIISFSSQHKFSTCFFSLRHLKHVRMNNFYKLKKRSLSLASGTDSSSLFGISKMKMKVKNIIIIK